MTSMNTKYSKSFCVKSRYPEIQVGFVIIKLEELGMGSGESKCPLAIKVI
jgi:hypothetical protein